MEALPTREEVSRFIAYRGRFQDAGTIEAFYRLTDFRALLKLNPYGAPSPYIGPNLSYSYDLVEVDKWPRMISRGTE